MNYLERFKELKVGISEEYPFNDISIAKLFCKLHTDVLCHVVETKAWYINTGAAWEKDEGNLQAMERCKSFAESLIKYARDIVKDLDKGDEECEGEGRKEDIVRYAEGFQSRRRRESLLSDARSVAPKSIEDFDCDNHLINCLNGTYNLRTMTLQPHNPADYITKVSKVKYVEGMASASWERFVNEIMRDDIDTVMFLQKALGYAISGDTSLECFFILYGPKTRNGKSTLIETIMYLLNDYARTIQPQTLSRRSNNGAAASPDLARLKGARLVNMSEPEKGLDLNIALVKQLTGGDTFTGRFLYGNPFEYKPEFKIFINTNHLPQAVDETIFSSNRAMLIPFDRHFKPEEQDKGLKHRLRQEDNISGIFNWLVQGYYLLKAEGLIPPASVRKSTDEYKQDADILGEFCNEVLVPEKGFRLKTSILHKEYKEWAKTNGCKVMSSQAFVGDLRRRFDHARDGTKGNVIIGYNLK